MTDKKKLKVVPYDSNWKQQFYKEKILIESALNNNLSSIYHIGSTSVPGLSAKPKIDIIASVLNPKESIKELEKIGYDYKGEYNIPMHYGFSKRGKVDVNLHIYELDHPEIELNLTFRDYLIEHPEARDEYAALKHDLLTKKESFVKQNSMFSGYNLGKDAFIRKILKAAGFQRTRIVFCTHYQEWKKAKELRDTYYPEQEKITDMAEWAANHKDLIHFALYYGVDMIGYAELQLHPNSQTRVNMLAVDRHIKQKDLKIQFLKWMERWLS